MYPGNRPACHKLPDFEGQAGAQEGFADPERAQCVSQVLSLEMKPTAGSAHVSRLAREPAEQDRRCPKAEARRVSGQAG